MTDIVERLRGNKDYMQAPLMEEAADEIERLRATLKEIADMRYSNTSAASIAQAALTAIRDKP